MAWRLLKYRTGNAAVGGGYGIDAPYDGSAPTNFLTSSVEEPYASTTFLTPRLKNCFFVQKKNQSEKPMNNNPI